MTDDKDVHVRPETSDGYLWTIDSVLLQTYKHTMHTVHTHTHHTCLSFSLSFDWHYSYWQTGLVNCRHALCNVFDVNSVKCSPAAALCCDIDLVSLWPSSLTSDLENRFSATATHKTNNCAKFRENASSKYGDIASHQIRVNGRTTNVWWTHDPKT